MADPWTRRELIDKTLDNLGVLVAGQTTPDELVAKVDQVLDPTMEELRTLEIVDLTAPSILGTPSPPALGEFPIAFCLALADYLAWSAASGFNLAGDPSLKVLADQAVEKFYRLTAVSRSRRMLRVDKALRSTRNIGRGSFPQGT